MLSIALADDHLQTLQRFATFIKKQTDIVLIAEAENGYDLIFQLSQLKVLPDVILIDMNMPKIDGIVAICYIKHKYPQIKLIALTVYETEEVLRQCLCFGANGFVLKALAENVLLQAIQTVVNNELYIDTRIDVTPQQKNNILLRRKRILENENENVLTNREKEFIILNATALNYSQIAQLMFVEYKTVQTYYDRISKKLNVNSRQALTIYCLQNGLTPIGDYY
jgi:DNA-binding NarL/FixJ family response regulator